MRKTNFALTGLALLALAGCDNNPTNNPGTSSQSKSPVMSEKSYGQSPLETKQDVKLSYESISSKIEYAHTEGYLSNDEYDDFKKSLSDLYNQDFEGELAVERDKVLKNYDTSLDVLISSNELQIELSGLTREQYKQKQQEEDREFKKFLQEKRN